MNSNQRLRTRFILFGVCGAALILAAALYNAEIINGAAYVAKANAQYDKPIDALFDRGTIYFSAKDGTETAAATIASGYLAYMNPKQVSNPSSAYEALSQYLPSLDHASFLADSAETNNLYVELSSRLDASTAASIGNLDLVGIHTVPEAWLSYPGGTMAAHELGLVGQNASSTTAVGRYGLELFYDNVLSRPPIGTSADIFAQLFAGFQGQASSTSDEAQSDGQSTSSPNIPYHPGDLVTTIEPSVEAYLMQTLASTSAMWHPDQIGGIIMDPNTGEIIALASLPTFDPNDTSDVSDISVFSNPLVESDYEMGSIMKPLTMAAALDSGAETPDSTYDDVGCMTLDKKRICNYDGRARGVIPMQQILSQSLNIGAATIALKMGSTTLARYFSDFGIPDKSNIDLPNEATPLTAALVRGTDIDVATASFGQGIALTPIDMTRSLAILANGGYLVTPHVVREIDYTDGTTEQVMPPKVGPVINPQTVDEVDNMLSIVADDALGYGKYKMDHYTFAAKTGTAEIADPVHGGYYPGEHYLHSFMGFFPAHNARFIIFLYQVYPKGAEYASETLTQPYDDLMKFMINYYSIPPDR